MQHIHKSDVATNILFIIFFILEMCIRDRYSKQGIKVVVVLAKKSQSLDIFRLVKDIDPNAFISQSNVVGVYGLSLIHIYCASHTLVVFPKASQSSSA